MTPAATPTAELERAYRACDDLARAHDENFPTASRLLPREVRRHIAAVYAFARRADDWADEPGRGDTATRRAALRGLRAALAAPAPPPGDPVLLALAATRHALGLDDTLLTRLLDAFERDLDQSAYDDWDDLLTYCRDSAEPVGRIVLAAAGDHDPVHAVLSDRLCTGLQLVNFWQDLSRDEPRGRYYLPRRERARWGDARALAWALARTRRHFEDATPLPALAPSPLRPWLRAVLAGGRRILAAVETLGPRAFEVRPVLGPRDRAGLVAAALWPGALPGSSFAPGFLLLPPARREALAALHAFCRALDDAVDDAPDPEFAARGAEDARAEVGRLLAGAPATASGRRLVAAWRGLADGEGLLGEGLAALVDGLERDARGESPADDAALERYCLEVGGGPGVAALPVFGRPDARPFARALGVALQRTNVLRDVAADARDGRCYVPAEDLARAGLTREDLAAPHAPPGYRALARTLAGRARAAFARARAAVPAGAARDLAPALAMGRVYESLLARLEADPARVFHERLRPGALNALSAYVGARFAR